MRLLTGSFVTIILLVSTYHSDNQLEMIWSDEFDTTTLDSSKWGFSLGNGCPDLCGWGNNELQTYTQNKENVRLENGNLIIEAHEIETGGYSSAKVISTNEGYWQYGRVEVRAKLPTGRGTWPAIWMLPKDWDYGGWPKSGEIDIMEHVGFDQGNVHGTVHTEAFNHMLETQKGDSITVQNTDGEFHVYSIEWDEEGISFFVDDTKYNHFSNTSNGYKEWPFDKPFYLILNLAVGGNWGGEKGIDDSIWPQRLTIDYVRVYGL